DTCGGDRATARTPAPHRLAASFRCGCMHSAEGAVFPIAKAALSLLEISDYWSREIRPSASPNELLSILVSAWWLGELRGDSKHSPLQLLKIMYTSRFRDDLGIVFIVGDGAGPLPVELPDDSLKLDLRPQIHVPSSDTESWDEAACRDAFHALAEVTERKSIKSYREFAVMLPSIGLTCEEFNTWCRKRGYPKPKFWQPPLKKSKRGRPAEYNWNGVKALLETYVSENGPVQTTSELLQKCADFARDLHPGKRKRTPDDKTIREAIKTHALAAAAGLDPGK